MSGNEPDRDGKFRTFDLRRSMRVVRYEPSRTFAEETSGSRSPSMPTSPTSRSAPATATIPGGPRSASSSAIGSTGRRSTCRRSRTWQTHGDPPITGRPAPPIEASLLDQLGAARLAEASRQGGAGRLHGTRRAEQVDPRPPQAARGLRAGRPRGDLGLQPPRRRGRRPPMDSRTERHSPRGDRSPP